MQISKKNKQWMTINQNQNNDFDSEDRPSVNRNAKKVQTFQTFLLVSWVKKSYLGISF